jgi:hypothetical protein
VSVLNNDSDPDGNHIFVIATGQAGHGKVTFTASTVTYRPDPNYNGSDSFTYTEGKGVRNHY